MDEKNKKREGITTGIHYNLPISEVKLRHIALEIFEDKFDTTDIDSFNTFFYGLKKGYELALKREGK